MSRPEGPGGVSLPIARVKMGYAKSMAVTTELFVCAGFERAPKCFTEVPLV